MLVRALRKCYVDQIREEGEQFDYDGPVDKSGNPTNKNLVPVKTAGKPQPTGGEQMGGTAPAGK